MISNQEQLWRILIYLGVGALCGVLAACRHVYRVHCKPSAMRLFFGDCLWCIAAVIVLFLISLAVSGGELRMTTTAFVIIGCAVTRAAMIPICSLLTGAICKGTESICRLLKGILSPFRSLGAFFYKKIAIFFKKGLRYIRVMLYNHKE